MRCTRRTFSWIKDTDTRADICNSQKQGLEDIAAMEDSTGIQKTLNASSQISEIHSSNSCYRFLDLGQNKNSKRLHLFHVDLGSR